MYYSAVSIEIQKEGEGVFLLLEEIRVNRFLKNIATAFFQYLLSDVQKWVKFINKIFFTRHTNPRIITSNIF